ncbi:MAG: hypothetical protein AAF579_10125 [Cyanobacteria bacterium P01_C01_bin.118]
MAKPHITHRFSLTVVLLLATLGLSLAAPAVNADVPKQAQPSSQNLVNFNDEDSLDDVDEGFNAVYVDREGNLLGTFVNVPGAKIKVYSDGQIELDSRDYTTEINYASDGDIRSIGRERLSYSSSGRIRRIGDTNFRYTSRGALRSIGDTTIDYSSRGRLQKIEDVSFDYDRDGMIESIEARETRDGIRIIVVN